MNKLSNFIGGEFVSPSEDKYLDGINPATEDVFYLLPASTATDVEKAVSAAQNALPKWSALPPRKRAEYLFEIADLIEKHADELAQLESQDQGKPVWLARSMDIERSALNFRFFAECINQTVSASTHIPGQELNFVISQPIGVCGLISPWNLPLYLLSWKIAPAIATGNTVVCKPSEWTSLTAFRLCQLIAEQTRLPKGVINMVFGTGQDAGEPLVKDPRVKAISFTGGTVTGRKINLLCAQQLKKVSLELGGKNATLVMADADLKAAVAGSLRAAFLNQGEICLCGSRLLVHEDIYDPFIELLIAEVAKLTVGDPSQRESFMGPLVSRGHMEKVLSYMELAKQTGYVLSKGSRLMPKSGYFVEPMVVGELPPTSPLWFEEVFGPLVAVQKFRTEQEAVQLANQVEYGLSASVWSENLTTAMRVSERLEVGTVWVNTWLARDLRMPFGGVKSSGVGREGGEWSLKFFTEPKTICLHY